MSLRDHNRSLSGPNHERAHPDGHAVRKVRIALEHQVVSPSWFVRDANDSEIQVCLSDSVRSSAPDVLQTVLRSRTVADVQIAADTLQLERVPVPAAMSSPGLHTGALFLNTWRLVAVARQSAKRKSGPGRRGHKVDHCESLTRP